MKNLAAFKTALKISSLTMTL